jgi:hypothetical protein
LPSALGGWLAALLFLFCGGEALRAGETEFDYEWGVAYYMPYDNDLERGARPIIAEIRKGVAAAGTAVAVQADLCDVKGMHRLTITAKGVTEKRVASENSADPDQLVAYLTWFAKTFRCRRYAVMIMNHGGGLDEMCLDENPARGGKRWMSGTLLGEKLRALKKKLPGRWELLFLQQCGRASLENLYSFRDTAKFVMASQMRIGAPNTYYREFHRHLAKNPKTGGEELARLLAEKDQHYFVYSCARAAELARLPKKLDAMLAPLLAKSKLSAPKWPAAVYRGKVGKRPALDAAGYFRRLAAVNGAGRKEVDSFLKWVGKELLTGTWHSKHADARARKLCGLNLYVPSNSAEAGACKKMDIYRDSKLAELWRKLNPTPPAVKAK